jgi:hypothetical protein
MCRHYSGGTRHGTAALESLRLEECTPRAYRLKVRVDVHVRELNHNLDLPTRVHLKNFPHSCWVCMNERAWPPIEASVLLGAGHVFEHGLEL